MRLGKPDWPTIKAAYMSDQGSFRELAKRYGISFHTLAKRAKREGWTRQMATLCDAVATKAMAVATEHGEKLGLTAAQFVERSIAETVAWLDRIDVLAKSGELDADTLKKLVDSWRATVSTGRAAFRLDDENSNNGWCNINIALMTMISRCESPEKLLSALEIQTPKN